VALAQSSVLRAVPYERIRSYVQTIAPGSSDDEIREELSNLKARAVLGEKVRPLGGHYWYVAEEWRENLREVCEGPRLLPPREMPLLKPAPHVLTMRETEAPAPTSTDGDDLAEGDIMELFKGDSLRQLVLLLFRLKGCPRLPKRPGTPYRGIEMNIWAETEEGALVLVECRGWEERVSRADVTAFVDRVELVRRQEPSRKVEGWLVATGEIARETEGLCLEGGLKIVKTMELIRDSVAYGVLGIGLRRIRPYVARRGEHGVFLLSEELGAIYGDPKLVVKIV